MPLLDVMVIIIVIGILLWAVNRFIPMDQQIKHILNIVVICVTVWWVLNVFGIIAYLQGIRI